MLSDGAREDHIIQGLQIKEGAPIIR